MIDSLGQLQLTAMDVLWRLKRATVTDIHEVLARRRKIAYTTVLTTMRALERRGLVRHETEGKAYVYEPIISREQYTDSQVGRLVCTLFKGSRQSLLCHLLGTDEFTREDLERIRRMLKDRGASR